MRLIQILLFIITALQCKGVSYSEQLDHIARRRLESLGLYKMAQNELIMLPIPMRRIGGNSVILGSPSMASHLPEAEAILPAHTLIKPSIGMLKSAINFPHKDLSNGAGVYGNYENIGINYDGKNERLMYSGFRRMPENYIMGGSTKSKIEKEIRQKPMTILVVRRSSDKIKDFEKAVKKTKKATIKALKNVQSRLNQAKLKLFSTIKMLRQSKALRQIAGKTDVRRNKDSVSREEELKLFDKLFTDSSLGPTIAPEVNKTKHNWFWQSKNFFSHVKFHSDAPEYSELIPNNVGSKSRNWWFYHQDDFKPFKD